MNNEQLQRMSWGDLVSLRNQYSDKETQNQIAPYEHMAYAREEVAQDPSKALEYVALIPGYQMYKALTGAGRSDPSLQEMNAGFRGVYQGLLQALSKSY